MLKTFKPGDRVRFSRTFLRNVDSRDPVTAQRQGVVVAIEPELRPDGPCPVVLHWDDSGPFTKRVLSCNLELARSAARREINNAIQRACAWGNA